MSPDYKNLAIKSSSQPPSLPVEEQDALGPGNIVFTGPGWDTALPRNTGRSNFIIGPFTNYKIKTTLFPKTFA